MFEKAKPGRDAFTFSLNGMKTIASFVAPAAIADDHLNDCWDERLGGRQQKRVNLARVIEDFLARYFAPGRCRAC